MASVEYLVAVIPVVHFMYSWQLYYQKYIVSGAGMWKPTLKTLWGQLRLYTHLTVAQKHQEEEIHVRRESTGWL